MDQDLLEGDRHLRLPEKFSGKRNTGRQTRVLAITEESNNGELIEHLLIPNRWGRLGKIGTELEAENLE
jgi:hypothetical protein